MKTIHSKNCVIKGRPSWDIYSYVFRHHDQSTQIFNYFCTLKSWENKNKTNPRTVGEEKESRTGKKSMI